MPSPRNLGCFILDIQTRERHWFCMIKFPRGLEWYSQSFKLNKTLILDPGNLYPRVSHSPDSRRLVQVLEDMQMLQPTLEIGLACCVCVGEALGVTCVGLERGGAARRRRTKHVEFQVGNLLHIQPPWALVWPRQCFHFLFQFQILWGDVFQRASCFLICQNNFVTYGYNYLWCVL